MSESNDTSDTPTIGLDIEVPIEGATKAQGAMYAEMAALFEERFETFISKNLDYGSSFLTAGQVDAVLDTGDGPFEDAEMANLYKLFTRIQDKDQRFYNLAFCGSQDRVGESAAETAGDAGVYWFMIEWLLRYHGEDDTDGGHGVGLAVDEETGEIA